MRKIFVCCMLSMVSLYLLNPATVSAANGQKALVVVSFGTTVKETRELDIEGVERALQNAFPDRDFQRAFTANIVRKRLLENDGLSIPTLEMVLADLSAQGYQDVLIQPTHLTLGEEYANKIMPAVAKYKNSFAKLAIGKPLLCCEENSDLVARALTAQLPKLDKNEYVVFMGHGSPNIHNPAYNMLKKSFEKIGTPAVIGVVEDEDTPNFDDMLQYLQATPAKKVLLMPLMLVAGDHALNDMAGDEEDSWLNQLKGEGYKVRVDLRAMGRNSDIQQIYIQNAQQAEEI